MGQYTRKLADQFIKVKNRQKVRKEKNGQKQEKENIINRHI